MPRPTTKTDLINASNEQFENLWKLIDTMSEEEQNGELNFNDRDKNLRDILVHLHEWHNMVKTWHKAGVLEKGLPDIPGKGYTWKTLPELNRETWKKYQDVSLAASKKLLKKSHIMILALAESHTNFELFTKGIYKWTKTSTLGAYFIGCLSSHYDWAIKDIKSGLKAYRK